MSSPRSSTRNLRPLGVALSSVLLFATMLVAGCDRRVLSAGGDGGVLPDSGAAVSDSQRPRPDTLAPGRVTVIFDKARYPINGQPRATILNGTEQTIFVDGCAALSAERLEGSTWVDKGGGVDCFWPGLARSVAPGGRLEEPLYFGAPGRWRARLRYGLGCDADQIFPGGCASLETVRSAEVLAETTQADCDELSQTYAKQLEQARRCYTNNPSPCTKSAPASLACGCEVPINAAKVSLLTGLIYRWQELGCAALDGACPPIACEAPLPAECYQGRCRTN